MSDNKLEEMKIFFDNRCDCYDEQHTTHISGGIESKNIIASFLPNQTKSIIDLGIGTGLELQAIFSRFPNVKVTGIDISLKMLEKLRAKYNNPNIVLHQENYMDFDLGHEVYDVALSVMSFHHYTHNDKINLYKKIFNCLIKDGIYIECDYMLSDLEYNNPQEIEDKYFSEYAKLKNAQKLNSTQNYHFDTPCTVENQKLMLEKAGFPSVKVVWQEKNTVIITANKDNSILRG